jgi:hypothetical protein
VETSFFFLKKIESQFGEAAAELFDLERLYCFREPIYQIQIYLGSC